MRWCFAGTVFALAACGGGTELGASRQLDPKASVPRVDAAPGDPSPVVQDASGVHREASVPRRKYPAPDPILAPPDCGKGLPPGETRATAADVIGRVAVDEAGNVYAPWRTPDRSLGLVALDPCGKVLWTQRAADKVPIQPVAARLGLPGEVLLEAAEASPTFVGLWRFGLDGSPLPPMPFSGSAFGFVGVAEGAVLLATYENRQFYLSRVTATGESRRSLGRITNVGAEECAVLGSVIGCASVAYDAESLDLLWTDDALEILDGTTRNVVDPALDGERLYMVEYGVSSYRFVSRKLRDGGTVFDRDLGRSPYGQDGLVTGAPVVGGDGTVYIYINHQLNTPPPPPTSGDILEPYTPEYAGRLSAHDAAGNQIWELDVDSQGEDFFEHATHVLGRDGLVYLATTKAVLAVDGRTGVKVWERTDLGPLRTPRVALSPNGDLLVQDYLDTLLYIVTGSQGLADAPWPAPGGDRRNANAR